MSSLEPDLSDNLASPMLSEDEVRRRLRTRQAGGGMIFAAATVAAAGLAILAWLGFPEESRVEPSRSEPPLAALGNPAETKAAQAVPAIAAADLNRLPETPASASPAPPTEPVLAATTPALEGVELRPLADAERAERPRPHSAPSRTEAAAFLSRAREHIRRGNIAAARHLLERAADSDDQALFVLAETYDPQMLAQWGAVGIKPNPELARVLYEKAALRGVQGAGERLFASTMRR